jgi:hypothetical protein
MKHLLLLCIAASSLFTLSCKKHASNDSFYERAAGIWVPYKTIYSDGQIETEHFAFIFGAYHESFKLQIDKIFIPVIWKDSNNVVLTSEDQGKYFFDDETSILRFIQNNREFSFKVIHFDNIEIWLENPYGTYYFRKKK